MRCARCRGIAHLVQLAHHHERRAHIEHGGPLLRLVTRVIRCLGEHVPLLARVIVVLRFKELGRLLLHRLAQRILLRLKLELGLLQLLPLRLRAALVALLLLAAAHSRLRRFRGVFFVLLRHLLSRLEATKRAS